jgi:dTDP-glucose 4,6-dehydratase
MEFNGDNMNVLYVISGVTGMTGNELVRQLLNQDEDDVKIIGFDNFYASSIETVKDCIDDERFDFYEYDLNIKEEMNTIKSMVLDLKDNFDEVTYINCAAVVHTEHFYNVYETYQTNVVSMNDFLTQAIEVGAEKYINCSTSEIYSMNSWNEDGGVKESDYITMADAEHSQRTSYATGKLLTEFFMKDAVDNGKIKGCSIRFANVYSKNEKLPKHIIPHIINSFKENGEVILLENSKKNCRTFLNNYDSCSAVLALARTDSALDGTIYNVATDEEISIIDLTKLIAEKMGIDNPVIKFEGFRESDPERRLLSTEKIRTRTDWEPIMDLDKGLSECVEYYTNH